MPYRAQILPLVSLFLSLNATACSTPREAEEGTEDGSESEASTAAEASGTGESGEASATSESGGDGDSTSESESGDGDGDGDGDGEPPYDCANLPDPVVVQLDGPIAAADMAFDDQGNLVGSNTSELFKTPKDGSAQLWVPGIPGRAATRYLPDGRMAFVQEEFGQVQLISPNGSAQVIAANLHYPFGAAVDLEGMLFVADGDRVVRIDPDSGQMSTVVNNPPGGARWLSFDVNYDGLFIGGHSDRIYRAPVSADGVGQPVEWGSFPAGGGGGDGGWGGGGGAETFIDGIGVDACGNVYVAEYYTNDLFKIPAGGGEGEVFVDWDEWNYGHGIEWGSGVGGWSSQSIFLPQPYNDHTVVEVQLGVPAKEMPFP